VRVFTKEKTVLIHVRVGEELIKTTTEHPFWVDGYGFKAAEELAAGDYVENAAGELLPVESVEKIYPDEPVTVYNFEVEDWHTYYVSEEEILVHNMCAMTTGAKGSNNIVVTEELIREVMKDASLKTKQGSISLPMIQDYVNRVLAGETNMPPIRVDGDVIVDGNHRYITSMITGVDLETQQWTGNSKPIIDWADVYIDIIDWRP